MTTPTLHDLARYGRHAGLVGEDRAFIATIAALAGDASVIIRGYSGTGKTVCADIAAGLLPEDAVETIDMLSDKAIWSKGVVSRVANARIVYFPEQQNAGDNDEVVKVVKKWGDGKDAEREKSVDYGNDTELTVLPCRTFLTTGAVTNEAHARSFDAESARRVVKLATDPSEASTRRVLGEMAKALKRGKDKARVLSAADVLRVRAHAHKTFTKHHDAVNEARFFGADVLVSSIPAIFPETRSAFALFQKVLLGVGRWYADDEVCLDGVAYLSPQRVAEAWAFYGDTLEENAMKWEASDREILAAFPRLATNGQAVAPESFVDMADIMARLQSFGITDPSFVRRKLAQLEMKGFVQGVEGQRSMRWHKTMLANPAGNVDWAAVVAECRQTARVELEGDALERYLALCDVATTQRGLQHPLTGGWGAVNATAAVATKPVARKGILAYAEA